MAAPQAAGPFKEVGGGGYHKIAWYEVVRYNKTNATSLLCCMCLMSHIAVPVGHIKEYFYQDSFCSTHQNLVQRTESKWTENRYKSTYATVCALKHRPTFCCIGQQTVNDIKGHTNFIGVMLCSINITDKKAFHIHLNVYLLFYIGYI